MRRIITSTALFGLFVVSVLFLPVNLAGHTAGPTFVGIYFDDPTVSFKLPAGTTKTKSITAAPAAGAPPVNTPAAASSVTYAGVKIPKPMKAATDIVGQVWLSSPQKTPITSIDIEIMKGAAPAAKIRAGLPRAADGTPTALLDATPQRFFVQNQETAWAAEAAADSVIGLRITVAALGVKQDGSPVDVIFSYGSAQYPSGVFFGAAKDPGSVALGAGLALYLDEGKLSYAFPTGAVDKKRDSGNTGNTLQQAPEWEWGKVKLAEKFDVVSNAVFNVSLIPKGAAAPAAGVRLGVDAHLYVNGAKVASGGTYFGVLTDIWATGNAPTPAKLTITLPTRGITIPANSEVSIKLALYSPAAENYQFLYGSKMRASSLVMGVAGGTSSSSYSSASGTGSASSSSSGSNGASASNSVSASLSASASTSVSGSPLAAPPDGKKSPGVELGLLVAAIGAVGVIVARRRK